MRNFAGIEDKYSTFEKAEILLTSIPYDGTSAWGKGADNGFKAFLEASENMELYDIETDSEVYKKGIFICDTITENSSPEAMYKAVYHKSKELLKSKKFLTFFGGEHSVSIGIIQAYQEKYKDLTVIHFDAHADLRKEYDGTKYNHACALHAASTYTNLIQIGIRSMDVSEKQYINYEKTFFAENIRKGSEWMNKAISLAGDNIYLTFDLDALDPSIMPATGTPEPGGLYWNEVIVFLRKLFDQKNVLGFDIVELAPIKGHTAPQFLATKLYYKMLSYKFYAYQ